MPLLEIRGLRATYGPVPVLHGIELDVEEGELVGVLGHNGMGKTTLLRAIMGFVNVSGGSIRFDGREIQRLATWRRARLGMALVPQGREIFPNLSVQENMAMLAERDVTVVGPVDGPLAGGDIGSGRMAEPAEIVAAVEAVLTPQDLAGRRVLVTSGGTREPIDAVRYVGNRSSGKQGSAVASEAAARGAEVVLVTTEPDRAPAAARGVAVETAAEMAAAVELEASGADAVVMAAAVADFRPANPAGTKIKKGQGVPPLELEPTHDILASLGASKPPGQVLVGFAAETEDLEANALDKLRSKNLDVIVANDVSKEQVGFGHDTNEIVMFTADGARHHVPLTTKREAARSVLDKVVALMAEAP